MCISYLLAGGFFSDGFVVDLAAALGLLGVLLAAVFALVSGVVDFAVAFFAGCFFAADDFLKPAESKASSYSASASQQSNHRPLGQ